MPNIFFFGHNHDRFEHIIAAVELEKPDAIVLLRDVQAQEPLEVELVPILGKTIIRFIDGNQDTNGDFDFCNLFESKLTVAAARQSAVTVLHSFAMVEYCNLQMSQVKNRCPSNKAGYKSAYARPSIFERPAATLWDSKSPNSGSVRHPPKKLCA